MKLRDGLLIACACGLTLFLWLAGLGGPAWVEWFATHKPFAGRALSYWLLNFLTVFLPFWTAAAVIGCGSLVGYIAALNLMGARSAVHMALGLIAPIPLLINGSHLYDLPTLALSALSLAGLMAGRWGLTTAAFVLWSFNRETSLLLVAAMVLHQRRLSYEAIIFGSVYALIRLAVSQWFAASPSIHLIFSLPLQLNAIKEQMAFGVLYAFALAGPMALVAHRWHSKPALLRIMFVLSVVSLGGLYWIMGYPFELRVLHEAVPSGVMLALLGMRIHNEANQKAQDERADDRMTFIMPL